MNWYVIQSHPSMEPFLRDRIEDLGRTAFLPLIAERKPGQRRTKIGPMFPGYLFAKLSETEGDLPRVRWTHGVKRLLGDGEQPRPVDSAVVDLIRARADRAGQVTLGVGLRCGDRVRILDGPLAGLHGLLESTASRPNQRVCVLLELFHRPTRVEVSARAIGELAGA